MKEMHLFSEGIPVFVEKVSSRNLILVSSLFKILNKLVLYWIFIFEYLLFNFKLAIKQNWIIFLKIWIDTSLNYTQSEINRRGNVENDWNSSVVRRSPSKAIIGS